MRGYTSGKTAEKDRSNKAIELIDEGIRKAEMANQKLEREQRSNEKAVHDADSIPDLIGLWSKSSSKATDDSPNKSK